MDQLEFLFVLLIFATLLVRLADLIHVPYPILLVFGGLVVGYIPFLPTITLEPEVVLVVFLPPLLTRAAFIVSPQELKIMWRPLTALALGLVLTTMVAVAVLARALIPDLPWAGAFMLGAIVGPTDPVAALATLSRAGAPHAVRRTIEGEALLNDASALTAFRVALGVATGATFDALDATISFIVATGGGVLAGLAVGWLSVLVVRRQSDTMIAIMLTVLSSYGAFILAEELHVSGVLAAVACGLYLSWYSHEALSADARLSGYAVWEALEFVLNALLFLLLGQQVPVLADGLSEEGFDTGAQIGVGLALAATVILVRLAFQFLPGFGIGNGWRERLIVGWSGMRGAISLALALSIPLDIPYRQELILLTFVIIGVTLIGQGLTLPALIRAFQVNTEQASSSEEANARLAAAQAALDRLETIEREAGGELPPAVQALRNMYRLRVRKSQAALAGEIETHLHLANKRHRYDDLRGELLAVQRAALLDLRNAGQLSADALRRIERELDLEQARL